MSERMRPEEVLKTAREINDEIPILVGKNPLVILAGGVTLKEIVDPEDKNPFGSNSNLQNKLSAEKTTGRRTSESIS
tara:strand:- start:1956 stop:2186 length:231 start_codon:yes stop_codon:yes gene_type:complete